MIYYKFKENTGILFQPNYVYVYNRDENSFDILNETAKDFIRLFDGAHDEYQIVREIMSLYEVEEHIVYDDLKNLTQYLLERGYITQLDSSLFGSIPLELVDYSEITKLVNAEIEYTNRCNLKCKYCYAETNTGKHEMKLEDWNHLLMILYEQGLRSVTFSGGEPFIRNDFIELLREINKLFIITINTNGSFINMNIAKELAKFKLKSVQISLDSIDPIPHDYMRGKGTWQKAMDAILWLKEYDIPIRISSTITMKNELELPKLRDFCEENGFEFSPETLKPCGYAKKLPRNIFPELKDKDISPKLHFSIDTFDTPCQASLGFAAIGCDGIIKPCNLSNTFFDSIAPGVIQISENRWYHQLPIYELISKSCEFERRFGRKIYPDIKYEYSQCVLERYLKFQFKKKCHDK